jgi:hypothetical protein
VKYRILFLVLFLFAFQPISALAASTCAANIKELNRLLEMHVTKAYKLGDPKEFTMTVDRSQAKKMGSLATANWEDIYSPREVKKILKKVIDGKDLSKDEAETLKKIRKRSLLMKSVYQFLDEDHSPPGDLSKFNSILGRLNDSKPKNASNTAQQEAQALLGLLDFEVNIKAASDVDNAFEKRKDKIRKLVKQNSITDASLHEVRKMIRQLSLVVSLDQVIEPSKRGKEQLDYLFSMSRAIASLRSHGGSHTIPADLKRQILMVLDSLNVES